MGDQSRMTLSFASRLWRRGVLLVCLLLSAPAWSADILLTAAEDGAKGAIRISASATELSALSATLGQIVEQFKI